MNSNNLLQKALGLDTPWKIVNSRWIDKDSKMELHIDIDFEKGTKFSDSHNRACTVHDTTQKTWRHLDLFQHPCYLHCRVPRIMTKDNSVKLVEVPWARLGSGFTLLFEAYIMSLIEHEMPINKAGVLVNENPHRLWTIFNYWVGKAYRATPLTAPRQLGIDETSTRRGHQYLTVAVDIKDSKVLHAAEGKDKKAVKKVKCHLEDNGVDIKKVQHVSMDMSPSFIAGVSEYFPDAEIHFDRFHVVKLLNEAMNKVRQSERKQHEALKGHKYTFLKKHNNLSEEKKQMLSELIQSYPLLGKAYRLKELFHDVWDMDSEEEAERFLVHWCREVDSSDIQPFKTFAQTIKKHWTSTLSKKFFPIKFYTQNFFLLSFL